MSFREKLITACAVLILGAAIGWVAAQIPPSRPPMPEPEPEVNVSIFDLSDEAWDEIREIIEGMSEVK